MAKKLLIPTNLRLGGWELNILILFIEKKGLALYYWDIVETLCGYKDRSKLKNSSCKSKVSHALSSMVKKHILHKEKRHGKTYYYLAENGRKLIDHLQWR